VKALHRAFRLEQAEPAEDSRPVAQVTSSPA